MYNQSMDYLSLCLVCKDENDYLAEWLNYHILMGVERFYIYDNDSQFPVRETLKDYVEKGWAVVLDISGKGMQLHAYDHCLHTFGAYTFWLGFIDTDEFLVSKQTLDMKELLQEYEAHGGLAVSSLFFGSNEHLTRPAMGQIAAYTRSTHETFQGNLLIKSIVQPRHVLLANSPHDFAFKDNVHCVNEGGLWVDGMKFPYHARKIQLNHYFCRSQSEIDQKLARGWADYKTGSWPRQRFDVVNKQAIYTETTILERLSKIFALAGSDLDAVISTSGLLTGMAELANEIQPTPIMQMAITKPRLRPNVSLAADLRAQTLAAEEHRDYREAVRLIQLRLEAMPYRISLLVELSVNYLHLGEPSAAWEALSRAWRLAPNTYQALMGMAFFFLKVQDYAMAEKTSRLLVDMAPHSLLILGYLTEALLGLGRSDEALKIGLPLVELADILGELPKGMAFYLAKLMSDHLLKTRNFDQAEHLWETRLEIQKNDTHALVELSEVLKAKGDHSGAIQRLQQAQRIEPDNAQVFQMLKQASEGEW